MSSLTYREAGKVRAGPDRPELVRRSQSWVRVRVRVKVVVALKLEHLKPRNDLKIDVQYKTLSCSNQSPLARASARPPEAADGGLYKWAH